MEDAGHTGAMPDTKLVKARKHWVCSVLAGLGWSVALTREGP